MCTARAWLELLHVVRVHLLSMWCPARLHLPLHFGCAVDGTKAIEWKVGWMQVLVELELPHLYHSVARNSPKRPLLTEKWGNFQVCHTPDSTYSSIFISDACAHLALR